jgi:ABC-type multidrug transport system permease subunit
MVQLTIQIFLAGILSLLYYHSGSSAAESLIIQDRIGLLFFIAINQSFGPCLDASRVFQQEKHIVQHEISAGAYSTSSFFLGRFLGTLPYVLINGIISSSIIYFSVGLALDPGKFFIFLGIISTLAVCSQSFGFLISSVSPNEAVASSLATPFIIIFVLTGGFYLNAKSFPPGAEWLVYISNVYYGFSALAVNELSGLVFSCYSSIENPTTCLKSGDQVLAALGIEGFSIMEGFIGLFLLTVLFLILTFIMLIAFQVRYLSMKPAK